MRRTVQLSALAAALLLAAPLHAQVSRPPADSDPPPELEQRELEGPRLGMTVISGERALARLEQLGLKPIMSVVGWHFEQVTRPRAGGPMLVIQQLIALVGLDQGVVIPSGTVLVGMRTSSGFEFGAGPNISPVGVALAVGLGKSIRSGGVTIPINLGFVMSRGALRTTLLAGYALRRR